MKYAASLNTNITNPEPHGYLDFMAREDAAWAASDLLAEKNAETEEQLADDELIQVADDAIGELYSSKFYEDIQKVANELVKAIYLGGHYRQQTVGQILSHLPLEAEKMVTEYIKENAN
ncbi:hypothetical protein [Snodgrassella alvi]|uniref:hypothetical protein n=1 Tax=Snodgrassella alvi TaxID=1196083 RepID=UPI000C1F3868|nr:hypothetical protein [Snodgrassella alvi]PIT18268.1 hypothetical protein BGI33_01560 [Snodgrassella alvi]